ncbi:hypothetical protein EST38_g14663 [Candolleomyces aberdarensis]|uniref:Uncharacterized protein n=1 Tax=Candolleomyces aberdarensis TaxID=2316362 RepID=A0A4Q2CXV6_9AGAR|nr:hypothetical protein EST38_g14663 [Candolleomyces aberdarensis]
MSIAILNNILNRGGGLLIVHDHLDDLEAFLYVFGFIVHSYSGPGEFNPPSFIVDWMDAKTPQAHQLLKSVYLLRPDPTPNEEIQPFWSDATIGLYVQFYTFIRQIAAEKERIRLWRHLTDEEREEILDGMRSNVDSHYDFVLGIFDRAIQILNNSKEEEVD